MTEDGPLHSPGVPAAEDTHALSRMLIGRRVLRWDSARSRSRRRTHDPSHPGSPISGGQRPHGKLDGIHVPAEWLGLGCTVARASAWSRVMASGKLPGRDDEADDTEKETDGSPLPSVAFRPRSDLHILGQQRDLVA
jgi:hypothetical protein